MFNRLRRLVNQVRESIASSDATVPLVFASRHSKAAQAQQRFVQSGGHRALDAEIEAWNSILKDVRFNTAQRDFRLAVLNNAGDTHLNRYLMRGLVEDLNRAIDLWTEAVRDTPPDSPKRLRYLHNLSLGLHTRYRRAGRLEDLEQEVSICQHMVQMTPLDSPERAGYLNNLSRGLRDRYARTGQLRHLEELLQASQHTVETTSPDSPDRPASLTNLGTALLDRYHRIGRIDDLEQALIIYTQVLQVTPAASRHRLGYLSNLGLAYSNRYSRTGRLEDLEQALAVFQESVRTTPQDSPELATFLANLGSGLRDRYRQTGKVEHLDETLRVYRQAVEITSSTSPDYPRHLNNLATVLRDRYQRSKALDDLEQVLDVCQRATQAMPPGSPDQVAILHNLSLALRDRYEQTRRPEDLEQAQKSFMIAAEHSQLLAPEIALYAAQSWGYWRCKRADWDEAVQALGIGIVAIEQLHRTQLRRGDQEVWLSAGRGLHMGAAYALVQTGKPTVLKRVVEVIELGRARGLGESLARDRSDFSRIERDHSDIYERYRSAAERVRQFAQIGQEGQGQRQIELAQVSSHLPTLSAQMFQAQKQLDAAIDAIRAVPGYERFLLPPTYDEIAATARPGRPLVYLIVTKWGSMGVIVAFEAAEPEVLLLKAWTEKDLDTLLITREGETVIGGYLQAQLRDSSLLSDALQRVLPNLGKSILGLIAARLREMRVRGVTLIPTGLLSLLPLHAATYDVEGQTHCLLDEFDVAYAPSARVLATVHHELQTRTHSQLCLVGVGNPLPSSEISAWAQHELSQVLPGIRQQVAALLPQIQTAALSATPNAYSSLEQLARHWREYLGRLEQIAHESPEQVVKAGRDLAFAAALFADLPKNAGRPLAAIAARIPPSLTYACSEVMSILDLLPPGTGVPLYEQEATHDALWASLAGATIVHLACHGQFAMDDTLASALLLAGDTRLTLRELVTGNTTALAKVRLAVLSACQTAITDFRRVPDESIGLPGGFLQAGVPAVVGSLWSVNDLSTALLMHRFYELHLQGDTKMGLAPQHTARALRLAQLWLRDLTYQAMFDYFDRHRRLNEARMENAATRMGSSMVLEGREIAEEGLADNPDARPYADPVFWAAFTFNGAMEG